MTTPLSGPAHRPVDLRSDTVTRPTPQMIAAMAAAEVGDDVYGEDPEVNALEAEVAALLGHEAGLYCPSGTMTNMLGVRALVPPGKELLCESTAHVVRAESGGHAVLGQVQTRTWHSPRGRLDVDAALGMAVPEAGPYLVSTAAIEVENTHNLGGGTVTPIEDMRRLRAATRDAGIAVHLDGARLWNAHVATGVPLADFGTCADMVSVCLSKGLGAPVGSVLVGSAERIDAARRWRRMYGGGMRQAGVIAAAGRYAVRHHLQRLADDHVRARRLAEAVAAVDDRWCDPAEVETNIVVLTVPPGVPTRELAARMAASGVLVSVLGPALIRLVTHLDVDDNGIDRAVEVLTDVVAHAKAA